MLFFADDEHDEDRDDEDEDADFEANSDNDEDDSDEEDEDEDSDDSEDSDEEDDDEDDDNKPVTRKEMREMLQSKKNNTNANRRVSSKKGGATTKPSDADKRLSTVEKQLQETQLLERKRTFGYENNLSPKQVNHVFRLTKRPTAKFLNKPHVKAALDAIKSQENVARNTPSGSGKRGGSSGGKKWSELKPEERQTNFADRRREILASKQR